MGHAGDERGFPPPDRARAFERSSRQPKDVALPRLSSPADSEVRSENEGLLVVLGVHTRWLCKGLRVRKDCKLDCSCGICGMCNGLGGYVKIVGIFLPVVFHMFQTGTRHRSMTRSTCCVVPAVRARLLCECTLACPNTPEDEQEVGGGGREGGMRGGVIDVERGGGREGGRKDRC